MKKIPKHKAYISFIVVGRNDNYEGDFLHRINVFVKDLITLCEKYELNSELVIVEWNPPEDRPRLKDAMTWPQIERRYCKIRIIEIPNEIHKRLPKFYCIPVFEYIGKNVGIRRARGEYVLSTNPDLLFSEELINFLGSGKLSPKCFYRIARYDVKSPVPVNMPVSKQLDYCKNNIIKVHTYFGSFNNRFGWIKPRVFAGHLRQRVLFFPFVPPHTRASGDFFLMHRNHWNTMRGYLEFKGKPHGIDGIIVHMALYSKLKEVIFRSPLRLYHQDHSRPESSKTFSPEVKLAYKQLMKERKPIVFNDETWGLGEEELPEYIV